MSSCSVHEQSVQNLKTSRMESETRNMNGGGDRWASFLVVSFLVLELDWIVCKLDDNNHSVIFCESFQE